MPLEKISITWLMKVPVLLLLIGASLAVVGAESSQSVPMTVKGSKTFYVSGTMEGLETAEFMVDTGSSYMTINEITLGRLQAIGQAEYARELTGVLANGDEIVVPVYRISRFVIGESCVLSDVEVAVFPGRTRQILGLNVLRKASPFLFSVDPPQLGLSNCGSLASLNGD